MEPIQKSAHEVGLKTSGDREALREFHYRRCDRITDYEFVGGDEPVVIVHTAVPFMIADQRQRVDPIELVKDGEQTSLIGDTRRSFKFDPASRTARATDRTATQGGATASKIIHDIGVAESVSTAVFDQREEPPTLRTESLEQSLVESVKDTVQFFHSQDAGKPTIVTVSYLNIEESSMTRNTRMGRRSTLDAPKIDTPIAEVPLQIHPRKELDPVLKPVWDEAGVMSSDYIDEDGEWMLEIDE